MASEIPRAASGRDYRISMAESGWVIKSHANSHRTPASPTPARMARRRLLHAGRANFLTIRGWFWEFGCGDSGKPGEGRLVAPVNTCPRKPVGWFVGYTPMCPRRAEREISRHFKLPKI